VKQNAEMTTKAVIAMALQVGFSTAFSATFFILSGLWLDQKLGKMPLFTITGAILGLASSLYLVWQIVKPLQKLK
jgi:Putative F0F1-ATPase subunit Ca2+/Mg2+ transporter